tara:strand:- start:129 stop:497 length:369 start_codon:yes stop_codon:yes gene_type:complete
MGGEGYTENMVKISFRPESLLNEEEKLSLLPNRMYLVFYPHDDKESFSVAAYDTTPSQKDVHPTFFVLKGLMSMLETDMDKIISLGQMSVMDKMIDIERGGEKPTSEDLSEDIEKVKFGKLN